LSRLRRAGGINGPQILVAGAIRIRMTALADEGDQLAVRRPRRRGVIRVAAGDHLVRLRRDVEHADVREGVAEITRAIFLDVITVGDDRRRRLALPAVHLLRLVARIFVFMRERDARAVRRPLDVANAALHVTDLLRFATGAAEQPDLSAALLLLFGAA